MDYTNLTSKKVEEFLANATNDEKIKAVLHYGQLDDNYLQIINIFEEHELDVLIPALVRRKGSGWVSDTFKLLLDKFSNGDQYYIFRGYNYGDVPGGKGSKVAIQDLLDALTEINFLLPAKESYYKVTPRNIPRDVMKWRLPAWKEKNSEYYNSKEEMPEFNEPMSIRKVNKMTWFFGKNLSPEEREERAKLVNALVHLKSFDVF